MKRILLISILLIFVTGTVKADDCNQRCNEMETLGYSMCANVFGVETDAYWTCIYLVYQMQRDCRRACTVPTENPPDTFLPITYVFDFKKILKSMEMEIGTDENIRFPMGQRVKQAKKKKR